MTIVCHTAATLVCQEGLKPFYINLQNFPICHPIVAETMHNEWHERDATS